MFHCNISGEILTIEKLTPTIIILRPPGKLEMEVRTTGQYNFIDWRRNGESFTTNETFQPEIPQEFPNFFEIYVREPTTTDDLGVYEVKLVPFQGQQAPLHVVEFAVILPGRGTIFTHSYIPL